jgi:hypothetical protein
MTHEVIIPDAGNSGTLDPVESLRFYYPEQPSEPLKNIKINWHINVNENVCPHCKQIINPPRKAQI